MTEDKKICKKTAKDKERQAEDGNTKHPPRVKDEARHWFFTWNNYPETWKTDILVLKTISKLMAQEEIGENGTKHIQGYILYKNPKKLSTLKTISDKIHWEKCRNIQASIDYCNKLETRNGDVLSIGFPEKVRDPMEGIDYYWWQLMLLELFDTKADDRTIHWLWEAKGNAGKTTFAKHVCLNNKDAIYVCGKGADIKYALSQMENKPKVIIWDLPRGQKIDYKSLEEIKNGIMFSTKYESGMMIFNAPHVVVFANYEPDKERLSKDRWNILEL